MRRFFFACVVLVAAAWLQVSAQVPQPFPRPQPPRPTAPPQPSAPPDTTVPAPAEPPRPVAPPAAGSEQEPTEATLGFPIYPSAQFIRSFDAGRGQRYYLFGSEMPFAALVKYYQNTLRTRGNLVFDAPATHIFEVGRFREETMAFPPGVTVKDYTWNGSPGYLNPKKNGTPERFPSIIQIVPAPPTEPR